MTTFEDLAERVVLQNRSLSSLDRKFLHNLKYTIMGALGCRADEFVLVQPTDKPSVFINLIRIPFKVTFVFPADEPSESKTEISVRGLVYEKSKTPNGDHEIVRFQDQQHDLSNKNLVDRLVKEIIEDLNNQIY